jgi:hypothetical protein
MPIEPIDPTEYERMTAEVTRTIISRSIEIAYPMFSSQDREAMFVGVIDRLARMRGWSIRRDFIRGEDNDE